jgi:hypothetical protein
MVASNVEVIPDIHYALYDPHAKKYYLREYRGYDLDTVFFYRPTLTFSGEDEGVLKFRQYIQDGNIYLLCTPEIIKDTSSTLERLYKAHYISKGKLDYRIYIEILKLSLEYEDYKEYGKSLTGFMTMCKTYEKSIRELWEMAYAKNQKN